MNGRGKDSTRRVIGVVVRLTLTVGLLTLALRSNREQIAQLLAKTKEVAMAGKYELFKTSSHFDSTAKHPDWLGGDVPGVQKLAPPSA